MKTSVRGLHFNAQKEAIVPAPYLDAVNVWTFGIGHTAAAGAPDPKAMPRGMPDDTEAAIRQAVRLFRDRIGKYEQRVRAQITVPLTQHEIDALVAFDFNTGGITSSSGVALLNAGDKVGAWRYFEQWNKGTVAGRKVKLNGLVARRAAERKLFFSGIYDAQPIPVWRVSNNHRPIYRNPVAMIDEARFAGLLSETSIDYVAPARQAMRPIPRPNFLKRLLRPAQPVHAPIGTTPNGLPIYKRAEHYPNWPWGAFFLPTELDCRGTGNLAVDPETMDALLALRVDWGRPMIINSGYRSPQHNRAVGGAPRSKHMQGIAMDVRVSGALQEPFIRLASKHGFRGIGRYSSFTHIDTRATPATW